MKRENSNRTRTVGLRFTLEEFNKIERKWKSTTCRKVSEYMRKHLFDKPITTNYRNQSIDELMYELIRLRRELNELANNFNQSVKKLHTLQQIPEFKIWIIKHEIEYKILFKKIEEIKYHIGKYREKWLESQNIIYQISNISI